MPSHYLEKKTARDEQRMHGAQETLPLGDEIGRKRAQLEQLKKEIEMGGAQQSRQPASIAQQPAPAKGAQKGGAAGAPAPTPNTPQVGKISSMPSPPAAGSPFGSNIMYGAMAGTAIMPGIGTAAGAIAGGVMDALAAIEKERERKLAALQKGLETQAEAGKSLTTGTQGGIEDIIAGLSRTV